MLEVRNLTKRYNGIPAVENISFSIRRGQILGYLGPNGSGKSTTLKMLTGLIEPTAGQVLLDGKRVVPGENAVFRQVLGYVPEEPYLYTHLTATEYLMLVGRLRELPEGTLTVRVTELLRLLLLWDSRYSTMASYSKEVINQRPNGR